MLQNGPRAESPAAGGYESSGAKHQAVGQGFVRFWKKMAILMPFGSRVGKITCFFLNYNNNYSPKFSIAITIIQEQVILIQLQFYLLLHRKDSQNIATIALHTKPRVLLISTG